MMATNMKFCRQLRNHGTELWRVAFIDYLLRKRESSPPTSADDSSCCPFVDSLVSSKIYTILHGGWRLNNSLLIAHLERKICFIFYKYFRAFPISSTSAYSLHLLRYSCVAVGSTDKRFQEAGSPQIVDESKYIRSLYIIQKMRYHIAHASADVYYILAPIMLRAIAIKTFRITYLNITNWIMDFHDSSLFLDFCFEISGQLAARPLSLCCPKDTDKKKVSGAGSCSGNRCHRFRSFQ